MSTRRSCLGIDTPNVTGQGTRTGELLGELGMGQSHGFHSSGSVRPRTSCTTAGTEAVRGSDPSLCR